MSPSDLKAALQAARGTFAIPDGDYGDLTLSGLADVWVDASKARFRSLTLSGCNDVAWVGGTVVLTDNGKLANATNAVRVTGCADLTLQDVTARGALLNGQPAGRGIYVERSQRVTLTGCKVSNGHKGVVLYLVRVVTVRDCDVGHVRTGTLSGSALMGPVVIEGNRLHDSNPVNYGGTGDHGDFLHLWTDPRVWAYPMRDVTIRGNILDQGSGFPIMGLYLDDNGNGLGFRDVLIEGNVILSGHGQGILLENVEGLVRGNLQLQASGKDYRDAPSVRIVGGKVDAYGNRTADVYGALKALGGANDLIPGGVQPVEALELARWGWASRR